MKTVIIFTFLLLAVSAGVALCQEMQISVDSEDKLDRIDSSLEARLHLFPDYESFQEARLYKLTDSTFVLEILYQKDNSILKERKLMTLEEKDLFQQQVTERFTESEANRAQKTSPRLNHEGRAKLLWGTFGLSTGFYSWSVPTMFNIQNGKLAVATGLLTSVGSFYIPYEMTKVIAVTESAATMSIWGGTRGILHGMALTALIAGEDGSFRGYLAMGTLFSIGEAVAGFKLANRYNLEAGQTMQINFLSDLGIYWGIAAGQLFRLYEGDITRPIASMGLIGTGFGMWTGVKLTDQHHYSKGDVHLQYNLQSLGVMVPLAILALVESEDTDLYIAGLLAGSFVTLRMGHNMIEDKDFSVSQGIMMELGTSAGLSFGLAVAYLVTPENSETGKPYIALSTLGAIGGFWATYNAFKVDAQHEHEENQAWNFRLHPESLLFNTLSDRMGWDSGVKMPLISAGVRF